MLSPGRTSWAPGKQVLRHWCSHRPPSAQAGSAFYEQWWFALVLALSSLLLLLLVVFALVLRGHCKDRSCGSGEAPELPEPHSPSTEDSRSLKGRASWQDP